MSLHDVLTVGAALAAVIIMILMIRLGGQAAGGRMVRRSPRSGALSLEATLQLDTRRRLSLVGCDGQLALILTGGPADLMLGWLPPPADRQSAMSGGQSDR